jgi:stage III sporulation protein SpoIIIAA
MPINNSEKIAGEAQRVSHSTMPTVVMDDLEVLLAVLPHHLQRWVRELRNPADLLELVLDLGRPPQARFREREELLAGNEVAEADLEAVISRIGSFGDDNRAGIERTLHRISCLRNRNGRIVGLTCRVGRAVFGTVRLIEDLVSQGKSVLLLGRPGVGKTTMLREVARVLADEARRRVVVVDTSNEIAGDGDIPHSAIGSARRMQVRTPNLQHEVMIEAVENHMPEVIIIDEIGTEREAVASRTIAERGVQLIATAHGNTLENLVMNPTLSDLVGGVQTVTLGDEEARRRGTQKSVQERKGPPTFEILVEIQAWDRVAVQIDVASTVDALLRGYSVNPEIRSMDDTGALNSEQGAPITLSTLPQRRPGFMPGIRGPSSVRLETPLRVQPGGNAAITTADPQLPVKTYKLFPYGISRERLREILHRYGLGTQLVDAAQDAEMILTTKAHYRKKSNVLRTADELGKPIYVLRKNTPEQMEQFLKSFSVGWGGERQKRLNGALIEVEEAVQQLMGGEQSIELTPQSAYIRRLQHTLAERYNLTSASTGREPQRRVIVFRP